MVVATTSTVIGSPSVAPNIEEKKGIIANVSQPNTRPPVKPMAYLCMRDTLAPAMK